MTSSEPLWMADSNVTMRWYQPKRYRVLNWKMYSIVFSLSPFHMNTVIIYVYTPKNSHVTWKPHLNQQLTSHNGLVIYIQTPYNCQIWIQERWGAVVGPRSSRPGGFVGQWLLQFPEIPQGHLLVPSESQWHRWSGFVHLNHLAAGLEKYTKIWCELIWCDIIS